ncbi:MAG: carboxypeptidase regulatory-like domain-containing protein [Cyanobacteria bacterium P01_A01_bin.114]
MKANLLTPLMLLAVLAVPGKALAHAVQTNYLLNSSQTLELEATFGNGEPFKGAKVSVYAPNNPVQPWTQGVTDNQGRFEFEPNSAIEGDWEVTIRQQGHGDILRVPVGDNGIQADLISRGESSDVHYAASPLALIGSAAVAIAAIGTWAIQTKAKKTNA